MDACPFNAIRNTTGSCECDDTTKEIVNKTCVAKCASNEVRNAQTALCDATSCPTSGQYLSGRVCLWNPCSFQIVVNPGRNPGTRAIIHMNEVMLFDAGGTYIPPSSLVSYSLSSSFYPVDLCFNGVVGEMWATYSDSGCHSDHVNADYTPSMTVLFSCANGLAASSLSRVEVYYRPGFYFRTTSFQAEIRNSNGSLASNVFPFSTEAALYTITL